MSYKSEPAKVEVSGTEARRRLREEFRAETFQNGRCRLSLHSMAPISPSNNAILYPSSPWRLSADGSNLIASICLEEPWINNMVTTHGVKLPNYVAAELCDKTVL